MAEFTRRVGLGRPLTYQEADDNFEFVEEQADLAEGYAIAAANSAIAAQNAADSAQSIIDDAVADIEFAVEDNANRIRNLEYGSGPYPSLDLLFTGAKSVDPRIEFERATPATYFDEMGVLRTAGPNEPRIDYDPETGECRGLLVERQATNLLLGSDSPATQAVVVTATAMALSFIGAGTITLSGAYTGSLVGTGDERVTLTFTPSAGSLTLTVSGNVEFAQLEEGTHPTSYIPTEVSQVTRSADHNMVSIPPQNSNRGGSLYIDLTSFVFATYSAALFANNPLEGYLFLCGTHTSPVGTEYGVALASLTGVAFFPLVGLEENKRHKLSVGWSGRSFVAFLDGVKVVDEIDVGFDIPSFNELNLFSDSDVGPTSGAEGVVNRVTYFPRALSDSELIALTQL